MTTGQRISEKRKELGLSQEALGEKLGVSRQSIYKWESDASLPDIDKLISLSRLFGVPVGWLLGVEEVPSPTAEELQADWTQRQEQLVEEVLRRYQQGQPKPPKTKWQKLTGPALLLLCGVLLLNLYVIHTKVNRLDVRYNTLNDMLDQSYQMVGGQINSITSRVEEILKSQNELTADYSTQYTSADLSRNTITFTARAVPKTYVQGTEVLFLLDSGDGPAEFSGTEGPGREFTAEMTCELTDNITISAVFVNGDTRQTQMLDTYEGLYTASMPELTLHGLEGAYMYVHLRPDGTFHFPGAYAWLYPQPVETKFGTVALKDCQIGLFRNYKLVTWLSPCEKPKGYSINNSDAYQFYRVPALDLTVEKGDVLHFAAFVTDEHGRQIICPSLPPFVRKEDSITWPDTSSYGDYSDIKQYDLTQ